MINLDDKLDYLYNGHKLLAYDNSEFMYSPCHIIVQQEFICR